MKVIVDGKQKKIDISDKINFSGLLDKIKEATSKEKRFVNEIAIDGVVLNKKTEAVLSKKKVSAIKELKVRTITVNDFASLTLENANNYLEKFISALKKFSGVLQSGGQAEDYDVFVSYLKGWISVVQLIETVRQILGVDFHKVKIKNQTVAAVNTDLQKVLKQVLDAFKNQDIVYLQDLLKYEMIPNIEKMRLVIDLLNKTAKKSKS